MALVEVSRTAMLLSAWLGAYRNGPCCASTASGAEHGDAAEPDAPEQRRAVSRHACDVNA